jgi:ATP-dependent RNA helicase DeaD
LNTFSSLGLSSQLLQALEELGFETPTDIQQQAIPSLINDDIDFIGLAQTGTGKTAAFGLPLLDKIDISQDHVQALILSPTRELAQQIAKGLQDFGKHKKGLKTLCVYGGAAVSDQIRSLKRPTHIVVATPGRLLDLIKRRALKIDNISKVILDEADEMLNMGFKEDINSILEHTPDEKNTWLFSATMPSAIKRITKEYMDNPMEVSVNTGTKVNENISHQYMILKASDKTEAIKRLMDHEKDLFGVIFCRTKIDTQTLADDLSRAGYSAEALHGDLSQRQRDSVMTKFKSKRVQLLIATDVAARGIDVDNVTHVIHHRLPDDDEYYTHRSGRTARAGKKGISLTLATKGDLRKIKEFQKRLKISFEKVEAPSATEIKANKIKTWVEDIVNTKVASNITDDEWSHVLDAFAHIDKNGVIGRILSKELAGMSLNNNMGDINAAEPADRGDEDSGRDGFDDYFINVGVFDNLNRKGLLEYITTTTQVPAKAIGDIEMQKMNSIFQLDSSYAKAVIQKFKGVDFSGREVRVNKEEGNRPGRKDKKKDFNRKRSSGGSSSRDRGGRGGDRSRRR